MPSPQPSAGGIFAWTLPTQEEGNSTTGSDPRPLSNATTWSSCEDPGRRGESAVLTLARLAAAWLSGTVQVPIWAVIMMWTVLLAYVACKRASVVVNNQVLVPKACRR